MRAAPISQEAVRNASGDRLPILESLRGLLAIVVFAHHFTQAFVPGLQTADHRNIGPEWLTGTPLQVVLNGPAAVIVFYVLTGFVLTHRVFVGNGTPLRLAALKRWPRLAGPTTCAALFSFVLFSTGAYAHEEAGAVAGSTVLSSFFGQLDGAPAGTVFEPRLVDAVIQGAVTTYTQGARTYDPVLWMIRYEFLGAFVALAYAGLLLRWRSPLAPALGFLLLTVLLPPWALPFLLGVLLGLAHAGGIRLRGSWGKVALVSSVFLLGATAGHGVYAWVHADRVVPVWAVGGALLLAAVLGRSESLGPRSERWSQRLGAGSFPLYLVHQPVIASVGSWAYLASIHSGAGSMGAVAAAAAVTILGCAPLVYGLARFDVAWVRAVNRGVSRLIPLRSQGSLPPAEAVAPRAA